MSNTKADQLIQGSLDAAVKDEGGGERYPDTPQAEIDRLKEKIERIEERG